MSSLKDSHSALLFPARPATAIFSEVLLDDVDMAQVGSMTASAGAEATQLTADILQIRLVVLCFSGESVIYEPRTSVAADTIFLVHGMNHYMPVLFCDSTSGFTHFLQRTAWTRGADFPDFSAVIGDGASVQRHGRASDEDGSAKQPGADEYGDGSAKQPGADEDGSAQRTDGHGRQPAVPFTDDDLEQASEILAANREQLKDPNFTSMDLKFATEQLMRAFAWLYGEENFFVPNVEVGSSICAS
jgi:hypothetical protein